jgi:hypothetical protein
MIIENIIVTLSSNWFTIASTVKEIKSIYGKNK